MKTRLTIIMLGAALLFAGVAGAQQQPMQTQVPLPAASIPQFVEPLPLLEFEFINATSGALPGVLSGFPALGSADPLVPSTPFPVDAYEFRSQILPSLANWPAAPATCVGDTASSVWGYISDPALLGGIRPTYLGPVVVSETGVAVRPTYGNKLPMNGVVQTNLPIDQTLDWADPLGNSGPVGCLPDALGNYTNPLCGLIPYLGPIPIATHLHGGEVAPAYDGGPDAWFTQDGPGQITGSGYPGPQYEYPNNQQESLIWFHDHALGITRLNVYAGLAGIMPIIDPTNPPATPLPSIGDGFDIPLILQDRTFDTSCEIMYNLASNPQPNPTVHPFWIPEFIGDAVVVNGKTWPYLNVEPRQYRFRFVNGANARMWDLSIQEARIGNKGKIKTNQAKPLPFLVIGTDDGYLPAAVAQNNLVIGNGERYDVIVDFSAMIPGQQFLMMNSARTPFPGGGAPVKGLTDRVMMFNVVANTSLVTDTAVAAGSPIRNAASPIQPIVTAHNPLTGSITRQLTLNEVIGAGGPLELVVNNSKFNLVLGGILPPELETPLSRETEIPAVGDTEIWEIINITADAHPMHTHLTSFQVLSRQPFKAAQWIANYDALLLGNGVLPGEGPPNQYNVRNADGAIGGNPAIGPFLNGAPIPPLLSEQGWKDTVITYPGEVTRIAVRWAPTDLPATGAGAPVVGVNSYVGFDPTILSGPVGYVWHCHIVDHEDNEMMRNYVVGKARQPVL